MKRKTTNEHSETATKMTQACKAMAIFLYQTVNVLNFLQDFSDLSFCYKEKEICKKGQEKLNLGCKNRRIFLAGFPNRHQNSN